MIEFIVADVRRLGDRIAVTGIVNVGTIMRGCRFHLVDKKARGDIEDRQAAHAEAVDLVTVSLHAYGREVTAFGEGMGGELVLSGSGFDAIDEGCYLSDCAT